MRYLKALIVIHAILFIGFIIQSCCERNITVTTQGRMTASEYIDDVWRDITVVKGPFKLTVIFNTITSALPRASFIGSTYATSCKTTYLNKMDQSTVKLTLDKPFIYEKDTIRPGANLKDLPNSFLKIELDDHRAFYTFRDKFLSKVKFLDSVYVFKFNANTIDGMALEEQLSLQIDL